MKQITQILFLFLLLLFSSSCITESDLKFEKSVSLKKDDSTTVSLKYNESTLINDEFSISFEGIKNDSRCPIDVNCVWAGNAEVVLKISKHNFEKIFILNSFLYPKTIVFNQYEIELTKVLPLPKSNVQIKQSEYSIQLKIYYNTNKDFRKIHLIDSTLDWIISKDYLKINSVSIEKNLLDVSLSYSGGCQEHFIDIFAYTSIAKSNPPQLTLQFSHNANNDMCEAYITRKMRFDLSTIKNYLAGYNSFYLNIYSTDGKLINGSPFLFKTN
ncbi:MAG: hypothetical protein N2321_01940 [Melioribacteraceae bacterium]|nr:hypothetical protein [Melioribacteraceae bacterium]